MNLIKPTEDVPTWNLDMALQRAFDCMRFLNIHGFMTDSERRRIDQRFKKWLAKHGVELVPLGLDKFGAKLAKDLPNVPTMEGPPGLDKKP